MKIFVCSVIAAALAAGCDRTITIDATGASLVAAQDGDGDWHQLELDAAGEVSFDTGGDYGFAYFCPPGTVDSGPFAAVWLQTTDDPEPVVWCTAPTTVSLSGATAPRAWVFAGTAYAHADAGGGFQMQVVPGHYDVVVISDSQATTKMTIVRDLDVSNAQNLLLPIGSDWHEVPHIPWPDAGGLQLWLGVRTCGGTTAWWSGGAYTFDYRGSGILTGCDSAVYGAAEPVPNAPRYIEVPQDGHTPVFVLPSSIGAAVLARDVTWTGDWDQVRVWVGSGNSSLAYAATAARFGNANGASSLPLLDVTTLPGWQPALAAIQSGANGNVTVWRGTAGRDTVMVRERVSFPW